MHYHHYTLQFPAQLLHVLHAIGIGLAQLLLTDVFFFCSKLIDDADNCRREPCSRKRQKYSGDGLIAGRRPRVTAFTHSIKQTFRRQTKHGVRPIVC